MNSEKPLSNLDFMLRGAGTGYTVGATLPIAVLIAKLIKNKAYRDNFKQNWGDELVSTGLKSAITGAVGAIPGGAAGYKIGKFINDSRQQQDDIYKNRLLAEALLNQHKG